MVQRQLRSIWFQGKISLQFLEDPKGIPFVFPDNHMGGDLICSLQDEETGELMVVFLQSKVGSRSLDASCWRRALDSITPQLCYTVHVRSILFKTVVDTTGLIKFLFYNHRRTEKRPNSHQRSILTYPRRSRDYSISYWESHPWRGLS